MSSLSKFFSLTSPTGPRGNGSFIRNDGSAFAIEATSVSVRYGTRYAIRDVSMNIHTNAITALVGPSGCGKSSFLYAASRLTDLFSGCHVSGSIVVGGYGALAESTDRTSLRSVIGICMQKPWCFPCSIRENIAIPVRDTAQHFPDSIDAIVEEVLCAVGLWSEVKDRLHQSAESLSGGQQQRLCLARAIAMRPRILLLDEPTSAVDRRSCEHLEELFSRLKCKLTIVLVSHNLGQVERIADYVGVFSCEENQGRLVEWGTASQVLSDPKSNVAEMFLYRPQRSMRFE